MDYESLSEERKREYDAVHPHNRALLIGYWRAKDAEDALRDEEIDQLRLEIEQLRSELAARDRIIRRMKTNTASHCTNHSPCYALEAHDYRKGKCNAAS